MKRYTDKIKPMKWVLLTIFLASGLSQCYYLDKPRELLKAPGELIHAPKKLINLPQELWNVPKDLKDMHRRIEQAERKGMSGAPLYHLTLARGLLQAADKQYEDADYSAANQFMGQAGEQLERANELHRLYTK